MATIAEPSPRQADAGEARLGIRFLMFPQPPYVPGYEQPEVVWLSPAPGKVHAGPADHRIYVIEPIEEKQPYRFPYLPPYAGSLRPPAEPGPDGHFDHLIPGTQNFLQAHAYACVRRVLDICESYAGREIPWFFQPGVERLELVPLIAGWDNAQAGYGYLELGESPDETWSSAYALNFDAVAHEVGHLVLLGMMGLPEIRDLPDFFVYHEAVADFISLLGLLQFDTALDRILRRTRGNLLIQNELDRFAETSDERQIRSFSNSLRMQDVSLEVHDRSKPFCGALFDSLLEVHQTLLFERGLSSLDPRRFSDLRRQIDPAELASQTDHDARDYDYRHFSVKAALTEARDIVGSALVQSWQALDPNTITLDGATWAFLEAIDQGRARAYFRQTEDCFAWRQLI